MIKQLIDKPHELRHGILPAPINLEIQVLRAYKRMENEKNGTPEFVSAYHDYHLRLEQYELIFGKPFATVPIEPNDWVDNIGAIV